MSPETPLTVHHSATDQTASSLSPRERLKKKISSAASLRGRSRNRPLKFRSVEDLLMGLHRRFGHISERKLKRMIKHQMVKGLENITYDMVKDLTLGTCEACELAKATRLPSPPYDGEQRDLKPMQEVSSDIIGKIKILSRGKHHYIALYVDHLTGYIVVHFLKKKSEVLSSIKKFVRDNVDFYGLDIKRLHVDFDPNYKDQAVQDWLLEKGISMSFSTPYHHQGNGRAERTVRKVLEAARTLMIEANAPYSLMDKYVEMAV
jgi:transposase InsO family protein